MLFQTPVANISTNLSEPKRPAHWNTPYLSYRSTRSPRKSPLRVRHDRVLGEARDRGEISGDAAKRARRRRDFVVGVCSRRSNLLVLVTISTVADRPAADG